MSSDERTPGALSSSEEGITSRPVLTPISTHASPSKMEMVSAQQERASACALRMRMFAEGGVGLASSSPHCAIELNSTQGLEENLRFSHNLQARACLGSL